jgi:phage shock protein PspC (stress-responsive transcriptional regulator)
MKKFNLDREHGIFCGVCAGLSNYFDIDKLLIRVLFLIFFSYSLLPYLIIALVKSNNDTNEQTEK